jgi:hypothetical protein
MIGPRCALAPFWSTWRPRSSLMHQREPRLSVHELARILTLEAAGELAGWEVDE